jgi:iron complex transport system substrate-binding protein
MRLNIIAFSTIILGMTLVIKPTLPLATSAVETSPASHASNLTTTARKSLDPASALRTVIDSRGVKVQLPAAVKTVATISDALIEEVMNALKVGAEIRTIGSTCLVREFSYDFIGNDNRKFSYSGGMNPANFLMPRLRSLPLFIRPGTEMNFETLLRAKPDVLLIQAGCCTLNWQLGDDHKMGGTIGKLKSLGIPTIVLYGPNFSGNPAIETLSDNIKIIGQVFGKEEAARILENYLEDQVKLVHERTRAIPQSKKPRVLLFGMNPNTRKSGGVGTAVGLRDIQSYMLEKIVNARNAFADNSHGKDLNTEHVLALNPDVFILPTSNGYHPPRELYDTPEFKHLSMLKAVKERRIYALPWSPCNCDQRLEYPINVMIMAKAAYPQLFADIKLDSWMVSFFKNVYHVDDKTANRLIDVLWMGWARGQ